MGKKGKRLLKIGSWLGKIYYKVGGLAVTIAVWNLFLDYYEYEIVSLEGILTLIVLVGFFSAWCDLIEHMYKK